MHLLLPHLLKTNHTGLWNRNWDIAARFVIERTYEDPKNSQGRRTTSIRIKCEVLVLSFGPVRVQHFLSIEVDSFDSPEAIVKDRFHGGNGFTSERTTTAIVLEIEIVISISNVHNHHRSVSTTIDICALSFKTETRFCLSPFWRSAVS